MLGIKEDLSQPRLVPDLLSNTVDNTEKEDIVRREDNNIEEGEEEDESDEDETDSEADDDDDEETDDELGDENNNKEDVNENSSKSKSGSKFVHQPRGRDESPESRKVINVIKT